MPKDLYLSELLITKLCHDLAGPMGAIWNGIEFLELDGNRMQDDPRTLALITSNTLSALRKLKFFRYIYGRCETTGEVDLAKCLEYINDFLADSKVSATFIHNESAHQRVSLTGIASKLMLALVYLTAQVLIMGGEITISLKRTDSGKLLEINGRSNKSIKQVDALQEQLTHPQNYEMKLETIVWYLAGIVAQDVGADIEATQDEHTIQFIVQFKA